MKTIKKNNEVKRVSDETALEMVRDKEYEYCPKSEWKKIRPAVNKEVTGVVKE